MHEKITLVFIRRPKVSVLGTALVCLLLWLAGGGFEVREGIDSVLDARGGHREVYERADELGAVDRTMLVDVEIERVFSEEGLLLVAEATEVFRELDNVALVKSLTHSTMPVRRGFTFVFEDLIPPPPWDEEQLARLEHFCLGHPLIRDVMISANGRRALITVEYREDVFERATPEELRAEANEIVDTLARDGVRLRAVSVPFAELEIREAVAMDAAFFASGSILLAAAVLRAAFLGWRLAGALLLGHLLYLSILPGLFFAAGYRPEPFAVGIFPLLGAVQLALLAHIGAAFVRALPHYPVAADSLEEAVRATGKACLFAALTTGAGLLALTFSGTDSVRQLGFWGAVGVAAGFLFSFGPALSILALCGGLGESAGERNRRRLRAINDRWRDIASRVAALARRRRRVTLAAAAIFAAAAAPGALLLKPDVRLSSFLPRGGEIETMVHIADNEYGGLHFAQLDFDSGRAGGVSRRQFLEYLWEIHQAAEEIPEVTAAYSYPQVLTVLNQVWRGGEAEALRLPGEDWLLQLFSVGLDAFDLPMMGALVDGERRRAFLFFRMPAVSSERYLEIVETLRASAAEGAPPGVSVTAGGMVHEFLEADRKIVRAQAWSGLAVLGAVGALLLVLWRSATSAIAGLGITVLPAIAAMGIAGYAGMSLNAVTVMALAIAIGVAVDDAVHFITCWRDCVRRTGNLDAAVEEALFVKGPPIFFTSVILIGAFLLLGFSSFSPVAQLGMLVAGALALTLPAVLLVLPCLLAARSRGQSTGRSDS